MTLNAANVLELRRRSIASGRVAVRNLGIERTVRRLRYDRLKGHNGCVNSVAWSASGRFLATGSDDQDLRLWSVGPFGAEDATRRRRVRTSHTNNILSCTFLGSSDDVVATLGWDRRVIVHDLRAGRSSSTLLRASEEDERFTRHLCRVVCHRESENVFYFGGGERVVYAADRRARSVRKFKRCTNALAIFHDDALHYGYDYRPGEGTLMNALCLRRPHELFVSGMTRGMIYLYDARRPSATPVLHFRATDREGSRATVTSLDVSRCGTELLASVSRDEWTTTDEPASIRVFKLDDLSSGANSPRPIMQFYGHSNTRTMNAEAKFLGPRSEYVVSGSDCGSMFFWRRGASRCVVRKPSDSRGANVVAPRRDGDDAENLTIASGGISDDVKLWTAAVPTSSDRAQRDACSSASSSDEEAAFTSDESDGEMIDTGSFFLPRSE